MRRWVAAVTTSSKPSSELGLSSGLVEHDCVDAERLQVVHAVGDAAQVADAVAVGVLKAAGDDAVKDGVVPPALRVHARAGPAGAGEGLGAGGEGEKEREG